LKYANKEIIWNIIQINILYHPNSGVTRGLRQGENLAEKGSLATVWGPFVNTQKELRNDRESGCGCPY